MVDGMKEQMFCGRINNMPWNPHKKGGKSIHYTKKKSKRH